ncbi:MAG: hypothetical protein N2507_02865 [Candidatus Bipolaricaulota bacterium]|nr:hypothetical protein [Candidatus Bipolaricaulota bacterium]
MKRAALLMLALGAVGWGAFAQGCAPCALPDPQPPCFTAFWQGEDVCLELVVPWSVFCGCCCPAPQVQVTGWRVVTWEGALVYQEIFPSPVAPGRWVWKQVDSKGNPVGPGYYKVIVSTTTGEYENTLKIVARPDCCSPCCFPLFFLGCLVFGSRPCAVPWCTPYVKLYRCPVCVAPCGAPCGVTLFLGVDP